MAVFFFLAQLLSPPGFSGRQSVLRGFSCGGSTPDYLNVTMVDSAGQRNMMEQDFFFDDIDSHRITSFSNLLNSSAVPENGSTSLSRSISDDISRFSRSESPRPSSEDWMDETSSGSHMSRADSVADLLRSLSVPVLSGESDEYTGSTVSSAKTVTLRWGREDGKLTPDKLEQADYGLIALAAAAEAATPPSLIKALKPASEEDINALIEAGIPAYVYSVKFKRGTMNFRQSEKLGISRISPGNHVIVEADRGEGIGIVESCISATSFMKKLTESRGEDESRGRKKERQREKALRLVREMKCVLRPANSREVQQRKKLLKEENEVIRVCEKKAVAHKLPMEILDAEFQHDRAKLTVFYKSEKRVDFRAFVRELFTVFKCRIWMATLEDWEQAAAATASI
jgi:hypothetical protein